MAIAFDNAVSLSAVAATTYTNPYTVGGGSNRILFVWIDPGTVGVSGVKYNGVALTQYNGTYAFSDNQVLWYLYGPASGSNTLEIDYTLAHIVRVTVASYSGAAQSGFPDNVSSTVFNGSSATVSCSLTPVAANCWGIMFGNFNSGQFSSATNMSYRAGVNFTTPQIDGFIGDTNGIISGLTSMSGTSNTANGAGGVMFSLAPFTAAVASLPYRALIGVGK